MSTYGALLKTDGVAQLFISQLAARLPQGMLSLSFMMLIEDRTGSFTIAGIAVGAFSIGAAICGPFTSRFMGKWGIRPVVGVLTLICALVTLAMALIPNISPLGFVFCSFVVGMTEPPIQSAVRTIYPKMVSSKMLSPLYTMDATAQEIIWVIGPLLATALAFAGTPAVGAAIGGVVMIAGGLWFLSSPVVRVVRIPPARRSFGKVLANPMVLLAMLASFFLIASSGAIEAALVGLWGHDNLNVGIALAVYSMGSFLGGILIGSRPIRRRSLAVRLTVVTIGVALSALLLTIQWMSFSLFVAGLGFAPSLAVTFALVSSSVRFSETAEAYGWVATALLIGGAVGSAIAGVLIDQFGAFSAVVCSAVFSGLAALTAALWYRWIPDISAGSAPRPDTAPVPVIDTTRS